MSGDVQRNQTGSTGLTALKAKLGLMYAQIRRRVCEVYDEWGVHYTEAGVDQVASKRGHVQIVVRDEYARRKDKEKKMALVHELHQVTGVSISTIERMLGIK